MKYRNESAGMEIGSEMICGKPTLYIKAGNACRYFAQFFDAEREKAFFENLMMWGENGGNDDH